MDVPVTSSGNRIMTTSLDAIAANEDLMMEIILRLPPKSLLRFQFVSKHWLSLISDPQFRRRHSRQNSKFPPTALFYHNNFPVDKFAVVSLSTNSEEYTIPSHFLDFIKKNSTSTVLRSRFCNGVLCVHTIHESGLSSCFICNSTTNQFKELPETFSLDSSRSDQFYVSSFDLAFDPSRWDHYRVVCVWLLLRTKMYHFSTYNSETNMWSQSGETLGMDDSGFIFFGRGVYWNGAIHWVSNSRDFLCFDVDTERFRAMPSTLIPEGRSERNIEYFGESGGHLHLIEIYGSPSTVFDVLEMERDYLKWFTKYRVDLDSSPSATAFPLIAYEVSKKFTILSLIGDEKEGKAKLVISIPGVFILYNLSDMTFGELRQKVTMSGNNNWGYMCQYIETLYPV